MIVMPFRESKGQKDSRRRAGSGWEMISNQGFIHHGNKGPVDVSLSLKSRPLFKGIPNAANVPGATIERTNSKGFVSGCAGM